MSNLKICFFKVVLSLLIVIFVAVVGIFLYRRSLNIYAYANDDYYVDYEQKKDEVVSEKGLDEDNAGEVVWEDLTTIINHEIQYSNQNITGVEDAIKIIKDDSLRQGKKCSNSDILDIDAQISEVTGIYGVNLCEVDMEVALGIVELMKKIYLQYPILKDYVTNLTLVNDGGKNSYIAAFKPSFTFATSDSNNKFPFVIKVQVFLNASYFLNVNYLDLSIERAVETDYFPSGADKYSLIAHEFGHVLTYILAINYYEGSNTVFLPYDNFKSYINVLKNYAASEFSKIIINEAFNNFINSNEKITENEFRENISGYANSFDEQGEVMYNETLAEAFHDYFLNGNNASRESLAIMNVLVDYIERSI